MSPAEVGVLLARMALFDARTVGDADVAAWFDVCGDLDLDIAVAAVGRHYAASTERVMPAHVRACARVILSERAAHERARRAEPEPVDWAPTEGRSIESQAAVDQVKALLAERFGSFDDVRRERFTRAIHRTITDVRPDGV